MSYGNEMVKKSLDAIINKPLCSSKDKYTKGVSDNLDTLKAIHTSPIVNQS